MFTPLLDLADEADIDVEGVSVIEPFTVITALRDFHVQSTSI